MPVFSTRLGALAYKFLTDTLSSDEATELSKMRKDPETDRLFVEITNPQWIIPQICKLYEIDVNARWTKFKTDHPELFAK